MHAFNLLQSSNHVICFAHVLGCLFQWGFNKPWGYHLLCLFSLIMLLYTVVVYILAQSFLFGHIKSYFLKNKVIYNQPF